MKQVIIDTDPGPDDGVAILTALGSPLIEVLGICAVAGNVPLHHTARNVRKILELAERQDVKAFAGAEAPLARPLFTAEYVHGKTGFDGYDLPEPTMPIQPQHAADFIIQEVMSRPAKSITICAFGPLTNLAMAIERDGRVAGRIDQIVWMGGALSEGGNVTPAAEFNCYVDPEAAARVLSSGARIVMMPLDVTHKAHVTADRIERFRTMGNKVGPIFARLLTYAKRFDWQKYGANRAPMHDPTTVVWVLRPELFSGLPVNVEIETNSPLTTGMTVIDWWGVTNRQKNAYVVRDVDAESFYDVIFESFGRLP
ncbi:nucleoside hydrolase [Microvirga terrae]|uniref:Nucleoside hydrolase n=1 Tax=Microvirga terrae TaxID=2740529 RepID=A0ABY5RSD0_9HYPH|nr:MULTISPECIES: nucleoside hydrolase [Microvirga]MBQ0819941.1 nucleoside hydrolase [Microvirga sp. HBU67558]UVF19251.1 nucleoside hydrolase [Microvirga terrae]